MLLQQHIALSYSGALQVISYESYTGSKSNHNIAEAVSRIEWTLREVLPTFSSTGFRTHPTNTRTKEMEE